MWYFTKKNDVEFSFVCGTFNWCLDHILRMELTMYSYKKPSYQFKKSNKANHALSASYESKRISTRNCYFYKTHQNYFYHL